MKTILTSVFELYGAVHLDLREPPASAANLFGGRPRFMSLIAVWNSRTHFRRHLAEMARDMPEMIDDIGLTMAEAQAEIAKPFWRR